MTTENTARRAVAATARPVALVPCVLALVVLTTAIPVVRACCTVSRGGERVQIADQEILIVWDPATKTEHFVRRASFATTSASFGFLVPTPGVPELGEAPDALFTRLGDAIKPEHKRVRAYELGMFLFPALAAKGVMRGVDSSIGVRVLGEQRVAGYDAAILEADDPAALVQWLKDKGYDSRPEMEAWLAPYVALRWKLTAFKLAPADDGNLGKATEAMKYAVRMSFATDLPLFPFRTPADQQGIDPTRGGGGLLRVFFAGPTKVAGALGATAWDARTTYARGRDDLGTIVGDGLPAGKAPATGWLTVFEDRRWPRASTEDLWFAPTDAQEIVPAPILHRDLVVIPIDLVFLFLVLAGVLAVRFARAAQRAAASTDA